MAGGGGAAASTPAHRALGDQAQSATAASPSSQSRRGLGRSRFILHHPLVVALGLTSRLPTLGPASIPTGSDTHTDMNLSSLVSPNPGAPVCQSPKKRV